MAHCVSASASTSSSVALKPLWVTMKSQGHPAAGAMRRTGTRSVKSGSGVATVITTRLSVA